MVDYKVTNVMILRTHKFSSLFPSSGFQGFLLSGPVGGQYMGPAIIKYGEEDFSAKQ